MIAVFSILSVLCIFSTFYSNVHFPYAVTMFKLRKHCNWLTNFGLLTSVNGLEMIAALLEAKIVVIFLMISVMYWIEMFEIIVIYQR